MTELTHLYILIFPTRGIIKIGKADEVHERIQSLKRWWGDVDYEASYYLSAPSDLILRLEKSLHFLLSKYSVHFEVGDGRTELFSSDALDTALKHIDLFCLSGAVAETLKKGVILPQPRLVTSKRQQGRHVRYQKKNMSLVADITRIAEKFGRINRLLIILLRKQARVAYQYDIVDGHAYFRLRLPNSQAKAQCDAVKKILSFNVEDFKGWRTVNCCSVAYANGILQYNVRLISEASIGSSESMLCYLSRQSEFLLARLPKRSPAAKGDIPMLNESYIWGDITGCNEAPTFELSTNAVR